MGKCSTAESKAAKAAASKSNREKRKAAKAAVEKANYVKRPRGKQSAQERKEAKLASQKQKRLDLQLANPTSNLPTTAVKRKPGWYFTLLCGFVIYRCQAT
jgi:hypothetical protein